MRRILDGIVLAVAAVLLMALTAPTAHAAARRDIDSLVIGQVGYNAVGPDRLWNRNQEYIDVSNVGPSAVNVKGLVVEDSWARANRATNDKGCNTFTVNSLPGVDEVDGKLLLQPRHTIRVYVGQGTPRTFGFGNRIHAVYMNHGVGDTAGCGYNGHFLNNTHDRVWIKLGDSEKSKSWDFRRGYYLR